MFKESYEVTYKAERYITLAVTNVNNKEYALVNHIVKDTESDVDNIYYIFTTDDKQNIIRLKETDGEYQEVVQKLQIIIDSYKEGNGQ